MYIGDIGQAQIDTSGAIVSAGPSDTAAPIDTITVTAEKPTNYLLWGVGLAIVLFALWYFTRHHRRHLEDDDE
jgi:hypothetical protein